MKLIKLEKVINREIVCKTDRRLAIEQRSENSKNK